MKRLIVVTTLAIGVMAGGASAQTVDHSTTTGDLNRQILDQAQTSAAPVAQWQVQQQSQGRVEIPAYQSYKLLENPAQPLLNEEKQEQLQQRQSVGP